MKLILILRDRQKNSPWSVSPLVIPGGGAPSLSSHKCLGNIQRNG